MATEWTCPFCDRATTITDNDEQSGETRLTIKNSVGLRQLTTVFVVCPNPNCKRFTLVAALAELNRNQHGGFVAGQPLQYWQLIPDSKAKPFPNYIPSGILNDYTEACRIRDLSPKASATLARRCLQGMIRHFWNVKGKRLVDEIEAIKDKIDPLDWDAIEAVRKVGNIGAHMEADVNVIVDVEPGEAELLIGLIESLLKDWYVARENKRAHREALVKLAAEKDAERKAGKAAPPTS
jgi:hypothetical protein